MAIKKINTPLISVIIPVFNGEKYLRQCLDSVLTQTYNNVEVIAVNDGSQDSSTEILLSYRSNIKVINKNNAGVASARNTGIKAANGNYIAFLDQDDFYNADSLQTLLNSIQTHRCLTVMGLTCFKFEEEGLKRNWPKVPEDGVISIKLLSACLFTKTIFEKHGFLEESIQMTDDMEWFHRLNEVGIEINKVDKITLNYRQHGSNSSLRIMNDRKDILASLKFILDERRKE